MAGLIGSPTKSVLNNGPLNSRHLEWANPSAAHLPSYRTKSFPDGESLEDVNRRLAMFTRRFILPRLENLRGNSVHTEQDEADDIHVCIVAHGVAIAEVSR